MTDVYISYSSVQVHVADAGNEDGWYQVADSGSVESMSLVNVSLTLGSAEVQTGVFNLISFNITSAAVTSNGVNVTAYVPANRISVPIVGGISVSTGNSSGVLVDSARRSSRIKTVLRSCTRSYQRREVFRFLPACGTTSFR